MHFYNYVDLRQKTGRKGANLIMMADLSTQLNDVPENYVNDSNIEQAWAIKAMEFASIHMNILMSVDTAKLKLNKHQDEVYKRFRQLFPHMDVFKVDEIELKGENKEKWRHFCEEFNGSVEEYNFGTMLRIKANGIYDQSNTVITTRIIFLAIEGARNVEGLNEYYKEEYKALYHQQNEEEANTSNAR